MTGLIVGSIIPDFEYFIRIENRSHFSHTIPGIFWFDLPLGLLVCFIFHNVIKGPLVGNSPYNLHIRLLNYNNFQWNNYFRQNWIKVVYSLIIGIITHIISDKLTHKSSNLVSAVPGILESQELIDTPKSIYRVIQITFSIIGLALCSLTISQFPINRNATDYHPNFRYWLMIFCFFTVAMALILVRIGYEQVDLIISSMSASLLAILLTSLMFLTDKKASFAKRKAETGEGLAGQVENYNSRI